MMHYFYAYFMHLNKIRNINDRFLKKKNSLTTSKTFRIRYRNRRFLIGKGTRKSQNFFIHIHTHTHICICICIVLSIKMHFIFSKKNWKNRLVVPNDN